MADSDAEIGARLRLRDRRRFSDDTRATARDIDHVGDSATRSGKKFSLLTKAAGAGIIGVAVGVAAVAKLSLDAFAAVDAGEDAIRATTGAVGAELASLQGSMKSVAGTVTQEFPAVGKAIADVSQRLDLTGKPLESITKQFLDLERVSGEMADVTIPAVTRMFGDWGTATKDQGGMLDYLFKVSQATGQTVGTLADKLVKYGAPLRQLGFDAETSAALLGKFEKEGVNADLVMGSMRIALGKMAKAGEPAVKTFERVVDQISNAGSTSEANAIALELFGSRAGPDMAAAIREGRFAIGDLITQIQTSGETITSAADDTADFADRWAMFKNKVTPYLATIGGAILGVGDTILKLFEHTDSIADFGVALGGIFGWSEDSSSTDVLITGMETVRDVIKNDVIPAAKDLWTGIQDVGTKAVEVAGWTVDHWETIEPIMRGIGGVLALVLIPHYTRLGIIAVKEWVKITIEATKAAAAHYTAALRIVASWVMMAARAAVSGALTARIWLMYQRDAIKTAATSAVQTARIAAHWTIMQVKMGAAWLKAQAQSAITTARITAHWVLSGVRAVASTAVSVASVVAGWIVMGTQATIQAARMAAAWIISLGPVAWVIAAVVAVVALVIANWDKVSAFTVAAWNAVFGFVKQAVGWLVNLFLNFTGPGLIIKHFDDIVSFIKNVPGKISSAASGMFNGLVSAAKGAFNKVIDAWNRLDFGINIKVPDWVPGIGGKGFVINDIIPDIPRLHDGGTITSGGTVNMRPGEELVYLPPAASVIPLEADVDDDDEFRFGGDVHLTAELVVDGEKMGRVVLKHVRKEAARS